MPLRFARCACRAVFTGLLDLPSVSTIPMCGMPGRAPCSTWWTQMNGGVNGHNRTNLLRCMSAFSSMHNEKKTELLWTWQMNYTRAQSAVWVEWIRVVFFLSVTLLFWILMFSLAANVHRIVNWSPGAHKESCCNEDTPRTWTAATA